MTCQVGAAVTMKNVAITKIYIHVIFSNFTKILKYENLELYGTRHQLIWKFNTLRGNMLHAIQFNDILAAAIPLHPVPKVWCHDTFIAV